MSWSSGLELDDWSDTGVLAQVLAASQQEYLDSLKQKSGNTGGGGASNNESAQEWQTEKAGDEIIS